MKKVISKTILVVFVLMQLVFTSCSSVPSESDARKILESKISKESKGKIELLEFKKTNGLNQNMFGTELYTLEFNALIEYKEGAYKGFGEDRNFYLKKQGTGLLANYMDKFIAKGSKVNLTGKIEYEKTENGWRATEPMDIKPINE